ncbi:hypothetical protein PMAYCL1PPCAC_23207, partial [Pristionchus mayeri]
NFSTLLLLLLSILSFALAAEKEITDENVLLVKRHGGRGGPGGRGGRGGHCGGPSTSTPATGTTTTARERVPGL